LRRSCVWSSLRPGAYGLRDDGPGRSRACHRPPHAHGVWVARRDHDLRSACHPHRLALAQCGTVTNRQPRRDSDRHRGSFVSTRVTDPDASGDDTPANTNARAADARAHGRPGPDTFCDARADQGSKFRCSAYTPRIARERWLPLLRSSASLHIVRRLCRAWPAASGACHAYRERRRGISAHRIDGRVSRRKLVLPLVRDPTQGDRLRRHRRRRESHSHAGLQIVPA